MDIDVVILFMMLMVIVLMVAIIVYMLGQMYIHQDFTQALLHILTGDDNVKWPKKKDDMDRITENVIKALGNNGRPDNIVVKMPPRRPPAEGLVPPEPQSYDEEMSNITELDNPNWRTGVGPSMGGDK